MGIRIFAGAYKDRPAVVLESGALSVKILPEDGAKTASLVDRRTGREFLAQAPGAAYRTLAYDGDYVAAECSGFDDMFPTIDPVYYEGYPWAGIRMPDHGEVCALPWDWRIEGESLVMRVRGVRLPYEMEKKVFFASEDCLRMEYALANGSPFDIDCLWAAHPIVNAQEGGRILVPYPDGAPATCVFSRDPGFGAYGARMKWPAALRRDGREQRLDLTGKADPGGNSYKIFFDEPAPEGRCGYLYPDGTAFVMRYPAEKAPYLALWISEGSFHGFHSVAPEPCTGAWDRIDLAKRRGQNFLLKARSSESWHLELAVERCRKMP